MMKEEVVVLVIRRMKGGDGGVRATGTQERGSKQGEALTSACLTLETEREGESEDRKGAEPSGSGEGERGGRTGTGRNETNSRVRKAQAGEKKKAMCQRRDIRQVQSENLPLGGGRAEQIPLTKLRVAVKRLRREATTVPLRLRPIRPTLSSSAGSAPRRTSRNSIGCQERQREGKEGVCE